MHEIKWAFTIIRDCSCRLLESLGPRLGSQLRMVLRITIHRLEEPDPFIGSVGGYCQDLCGKSGSAATH